MRPQQLNETVNSVWNDRHTLFVNGKNTQEDGMYDIIIIGGGPAGLTAAIYARRAGKSVLVLEKDALGGQITWSPRVENYPAIPSVSGMDLGNLMAEQAMEQGAEVEIDEAVEIRDCIDHKLVRCAFGTEYEGRAVILATGAKPRTLGVAREDELVGSGVGYCAVCDGAFYKDQIVAVNGGGLSGARAIYTGQVSGEVVYKIWYKKNLADGWTLLGTQTKKLTESGEVVSEIQISGSIDPDSGFFKVTLE